MRRWEERVSEKETPRDELHAFLRGMGVWYHSMWVGTRAAI